jgi:hypothetical protein
MNSSRVMLGSPPNSWCERSARLFTVFSIPIHARILLVDLFPDADQPHEVVADDRRLREGHATPLTPTRDQQTLDRGPVVLGVCVGEAKSAVGVALAKDVWDTPAVSQDAHPSRLRGHLGRGGGTEVGSHPPNDHRAVYFMFLV